MKLISILTLHIDLTCGNVNKVVAAVDIPTNQYSFI